MLTYMIYQAHNKGLVERALLVTSFSDEHRRQVLCKTGETLSEACLVCMHRAEWFSQAKQPSPWRPS